MKIKNVYVITTEGYAIGYNVAREYMGNFRARDYIAPVQRVYGDRLVPTNPLCFETIERAKKYMDKNLYSVGKICEYNPNMNCLVKEVEFNGI